MSVSDRPTRLAYIRSLIHRTAWVGWLQLRNRLNRSSVLGAAPVVVSLTTFGVRLKYVHISIESVAAGSARPSRLVLWLSQESADDPLPKGLQRLRKRGLEVKFVEDVGPHTKYFPYLLEPGDVRLPLVTSDDDTLYKRDWLSSLVDTASNEVREIVVHRAHRFGVDSLANPHPYSTWVAVDDQVARYSNFGTGVSGAFYPTSFLELLRTEGMEFRKVAPKADDVWLHSRSVKFGYKTRQVAAESHRVVNIPGTQKQALNTDNVTAGSGNDRQIALSYPEPSLQLIVNDSPSPAGG